MRDCRQAEAGHSVDGGECLYESPDKWIALSFSTYNFSLEVVHIVCEDACQDRDEDVEEADDDVGFSDLGAGEAETDHVKVDEGVDEGETNGLEEEH